MPLGKLTARHLLSGNRLMENPVTLIHLSNCQCEGLAVPDWSIQSGDSWCVFGRNGSGKQLIDQLLVGEIMPSQGVVERALTPDQIALISFERQQVTYEEEWRLAATDIIPEHEWGTRVAEFLPQERLEDPLIDQLNMRHRLQAFYRELSTGESRKLMVLKALLDEAELLICDNPFDSLDQGTVLALSETFRLAVASGVAVILLLSNRSDIPKWVEKFGHVDAGLLRAFAGSRDAQLVQLEAAIGTGAIVQPGIPEDAIRLDAYDAPYIADLNQCTVRYGDRDVLDALTAMGFVLVSAGGYGALRSLEARAVRLKHGEEAAAALPPLGGAAEVDVVVVGSGQGGLSCAATLSQFGETVIVCEQHEAKSGSTARHPVAPDHRRAPQRRYNELATMTIKATGAVTSSVANTAKRVIVMVYMAAITGKALTEEQTIGAAVAMWHLPVPRRVHVQLGARSMHIHNQVRRIANEAPRGVALYK